MRSLAAYKPDESNVGVWLWLGLIVVVNAYWITADIWLHSHGKEMLTDEFREGLQSVIWGPVLAFLTLGTIGAFAFHMFVQKTPGSSQ